MPRKQSIIIFPHLNDCGGDLSKDWYVEWKYRIQGEAMQRKERCYKGLNSGPPELRYKLAKKIIKEKTDWLKSGKYLQGNDRRVYADELLYRTEAKLFGQFRNEIVTTRTNLSEFLRLQKQQLNHKSYMDYQSKMRMFNLWLSLNKYDELRINNIERKHIIEFASYLSEKGLARLTINKYIQTIRAFFDFEVERGNVLNNPVVKIPKMGKIVDCAATPFTSDERLRLKEAIKPVNPQLWLACQIQYYCAIRPGTELRLMKINWIDFENMQLRVPNVEAKNNATEIVEIPEILFIELCEYDLKHFDKTLYLFGKNGYPGIKPLGKNTLRNRFNRYREKLGIPTNRKFYSWKHTGAIELIQNGAQPYDVMEHLRHKNFDTTEKYLKKRIKNKDKRINQFVTEI
jgi:integrase